MTSMEVMAINPANEGYVLVKNGGRQGDVKLENALGKSYRESEIFKVPKGRRGRGTWMNAVAMMTPVPKCFTEKNTQVGIRSFLTLFATIGNRAPYPKSVFGGKGESTKSGTEEDGKQAKEMYS
jgi:hypothetical protein